VKPPLRLAEMPRWHGWRTSSESKRIVRWVEEMLVMPIGAGAGGRMRVAPFQRRLLERMCESLATFISIPAGNGKTTLMAAVALERVARGDDYVEVDVLATKEDQARRLVESALRMVECAPQLQELFDFYSHDAVLEYKPTGSTMRAHPAKLSAIQGLNFSLALVDEVGDVPAELVTSLLARLGKRADSRLVGFGTPGTSMRDNMLEVLRGQWREDTLPPGVQFVEYAAEAGCAVDDRAQWRKANPAIRAGFLRAESMPLKAAAMPEHLFRAYHLGQPVESSGPWLPHEAWARCDRQPPPMDGTRVVLALDGSYRRQAALVGCTLDGGVFFGWAADHPSDDEIADAIRAAGEQWELLELVHNPHLRLGLMARLAEEGLPVAPWPHDVATDVDSTAAFYQAIAERTVAHDHDQELGAQVQQLTGKVDRHGNPRLVRTSDPDVTLAFAARMAWWRALKLAETDPSDDPVIW
jgi:phage terminase large subunit-like protein